MPLMPSINGIAAGESVKLRARRGSIPVRLWNPLLITDRRVPPGLWERVTATLWMEHGDHPAVLKLEEPIGLADALEVVRVKDGMVELYKGKPAVPAPKVDGVTPADGTPYYQIRPVDAIVRNEDHDGHFVDHIVMPGFYIIEDDADGGVYALSPHHVRAWFVVPEAAA